MRASSSSMQEIFRGMQFPMRKEQIVEHARKQNASSDVIEDLQMIPDREYESADSVMRAMETASQTAGGQGVGGKSQGFGGTGTGGSGGGGASTGGSSQSFGGRGGK